MDMLRNVITTRCVISCILRLHHQSSPCLTVTGPNTALQRNPFHMQQALLQIVPRHQCCDSGKLHSILILHQIHTLRRVHLGAHRTSLFSGLSKACPILNMRPRFDRHPIKPTPLLLPKNVHKIPQTVMSLGINLQMITHRQD